MKAIVYYESGSPDVLQLAEIEKPVPGDNQVLIKVRAAALNPLDRHLLKKSPALFRLAFRLPQPSEANPGRPGRDVAGEVEAIGKDMTEFKPGDEVFGVALGACAEYACGSKVVLKPANVSFEEAASTPVAVFTAFQGLRDHGQIQPGSKVLINGAAGGVGTFAVQIAKSYGAEVTGVCSTGNVEMVRSIGADHVIDYTQEDFAESGQRYDLVLDCVWTHSIAASRRALEPNGRYVIVGGPVSGGMGGFVARALAAKVRSAFGSQKFVLFMAKSNKEDLALIGELMANGKVKPVIDRRYSLSEVPDAVRYLELGHARGKVIINVS